MTGTSNETGFYGQIKQKKSAFWQHIYLHIYGFSDVVNLLSSSPGTQCTCTRVLVPWNMSHDKDLKKQSKITWLLQKMHVYVLFSFIDTISRLKAG